MKRISRYFISSLLICWITLPGQSQSKKGEPENLYLKALSASFAAGMNSNKQMTTVEKHTLLLDSFPDQIDGHRLGYLNGKELVDRYKTERKPIWLTVIRPIRNEGAKLVINIANYDFSYEKNRMAYALDSGCKVTFRYNCSSDSFEVEDVQCSGV